MEEGLVLEIEQRLNIVLIKIVKLIVNGQHGKRKVNVPDHVKVVNKYSQGKKKLKLKMEENLVLELIQRLKLATIKTVLNQVNSNN